MLLDVLERAPRVLFIFFTHGSIAWPKLTHDSTTSSTYHGLTMQLIQSNWSEYVVFALFQAWPIASKRFVSLRIKSFISFSFASLWHCSIDNHDAWAVCDYIRFFLLHFFLVLLLARIAPFFGFQPLPLNLVSIYAPRTAPNLPGSVPISLTLKASGPLKFRFEGDYWETILRFLREG